MTTSVASLSAMPGSLIVKGGGPQQQHEPPVSPALHKKHRPTTLPQDLARFGSVGSLPPYEALYGASRSAQDGSPILIATSDIEVGEPIEPLLASLPGSTHRLGSNLDSLVEESELELDDTVQLDRLILQSSVALATAQSLLAGSLSVRGAVHDLNSADAEGDAVLERIEVETRIGMRRGVERANTLDPLLRAVSIALEGLEEPSFVLSHKPSFSKSPSLSRRLEVGRGSVGELSATRAEPEWTIRRPRQVDEIDRESPGMSLRPAYSLRSPNRETVGSARGAASASILEGRNLQGKAAAVAVHPVASTSISSHPRDSTPRFGSSSGLPQQRVSEALFTHEDLSQKSSERVRVTDQDQPLPSTPTKPMTPLSNKASPIVRPVIPTQELPAGANDFSPSRPRASQHTRSLSSLLPSLAPPSLADSSAAHPLVNGAASDDSGNATPSTPSSACSPAVSRLKALGTSSSSSAPQPAGKSWGWFASASSPT